MVFLLGLCYSSGGKYFSWKVILFLDASTLEGICFSWKVFFLDGRNFIGWLLSNWREKLFLGMVIFLEVVIFLGGNLLGVAFFLGWYSSWGG